MQDELTKRPVLQLCQDVLPHIQHSRMDQGQPRTFLECLTETQALVLVFVRHHNSLPACPGAERVVSVSEAKDCNPTCRRTGLASAAAVPYQDAISPGQCHQAATLGNNIRCCISTRPLCGVRPCKIITALPVILVDHGSVQLRAQLLLTCSWKQSRDGVLV